MTYYSAIKRNGTTYLHLENMLSERSQDTKGHTLYELIYMKCPEWVNTEKSRKQISGCQGPWENGDGEGLL